MKEPPPPTLAGPPGLARRTILVTGATSGIGLEAACALAASGARVLVGARNAEGGRSAIEEIERRGLGGAGGSVEPFEADLASFASVRAAAARLSERLGARGEALDALVNNAGVASKRRTLTEDGHELTWQTNFLSAFLLTRLLLPALRRSSDPRVVNVGSEGHRVGRIEWEDLELEHRFGTFRAYAASKLALNLFTRELARREPAVHANAVHPGAIATRIWRPLPAPVQAVIGLVLPSARRGARPLVRLATAPELAGVTGRYFDRQREATPSVASRDDAAAERLWRIAEEAVRDPGSSA